MLFILDDLSHELAFGDYLLADKGIALHHGAAATQFGHERHMEDQSVAWNYFLAKLHIVDLHEVCRIAFGLVETAEHQDAAGLRHSLDLKHSGSTGSCGK